NGRIKATRNDPAKLLELWEELVQNDSIALDESSFRHIQKAPYQDGYVLKKEITSDTQHQVQGYFIVYLRHAKLLTSIAYQIMESLTAATALWISREDAIVQTELRLRNEFIWGLAKTPQVTSDENLLSRAKLFGYQLSVPYLCIVG